MTSWKGVLDYSPEERRVVIMHQEDGRQYIETRQDAAPMIKAAKMLAEIPPDPETGWRFVCAIPKSELDRSFNEGWFHDKEAWRRWAKDRDNRKYNGERENPF